MAELGDGNITLQEWGKRNDPDGTSAEIVELMEETNEILQDMPYIEGNLPTGHRSTTRTGLPSVVWRKLNKGVPNSKSTTVQVDDTMGMLEGYSDVDIALADLNGNTASFRLSEAKAFFQAMGNDKATNLIYGDSSLDPEQPLGFAPRYPYKDSPNVVDFAGTGSDVTSIWIVDWGPETVTGIFPKGSNAGMIHMNKGQQSVLDGDGNKYEAYQDWYKLTTGLSVRNWRHVVRCCNVESTGLTGSPLNLIDKMYLLIAALNKLPNRNSGNIRIYCNEDVFTQFDVAAYDKTVPNVYTVDAGGKHQTVFMGHPIRKCDAILSSEVALIATP